MIFCNCHTEEPMNNLLTLVISAALVSGAATAPDTRPKVSLHSTTKSEVSKEVDEQLIADTEECRTELAQLAQNNALTMNAFDNLMEETLTAYRQERSLSQEDVLTILDGISFAAKKHDGQTRKNAEKTPYISHPIGVAVHLMKIGKVRDVNTIVAALLHDTVEDTKTELTQIEKLFGSTVAGYVKEVSDNKSLPAQERKRLQVINASHKSAAAAQIKLADKLYNLNDLINNPPSDWTRTRIDQYFQWAKSVVDRLPPSNENLAVAIQDCIDSYWASQAPSNKK